MPQKYQETVVFEKIITQIERFFVFCFNLANFVILIIMVSDSVVNEPELSPYCGNRYRYVRYYNDSIFSLNFISDSEFRLFRSLLFHSDVITNCVMLCDSRVRFDVIGIAYRGIDSWDGNVRRYQRDMKVLKGKRLVLSSNSVTGRRSVMVNPRVAFAGDFHDRKKAIQVWDRLFGSKV